MGDRGAADSLLGLDRKGLGMRALSLLVEKYTENYLESSSCRICVWQQASQTDCPEAGQT